jgi:hypothetical protein
MQREDKMQAQNWQIIAKLPNSIWKFIIMV